MKKYLFLSTIACAAIMATSCSNEDVNGNEPKGNAIEFGTYIGRNPVSKATVTEDASIKTSGFGVFASMTSGDWDATATPKFMCNQHVTYDNSKSEWTYSPLKYWPQNEKISFFAYAPFSTNGVTFSDKDKVGAPTATVTLQTDIANMVDFVAACAMNQTKPKDNSAVNFTLKHELSRVAFKAKTDVADENTTITLKSVTLGGDQLYGEGVYTFPTTTGGKGSWSYTGKNSTTISVYNGADILRSTNTKDLHTDYLFLFPLDNSITKTGISATLTYTVTTKDDAVGGSTTATEYTKTVYLTALAQGTAYTYTFVVGLDAIKLSASVEGWGTETSEDIQVK